MIPLESMPPADWAKRVNRWIVHQSLAEHTEEWLRYLENLQDGRFQRSCEIARIMSHQRQHHEDPKPWFYSGIFALATPAEARRFLSTHRMTSSIIPATKGDPALARWVNTLSPETSQLLQRLRERLVFSIQQEQRRRS